MGSNGVREHQGVSEPVSLIAAEFGRLVALAEASPRRRNDTMAPHLYLVLTRVEYGWAAVHTNTSC